MRIPFYAFLHPDYRFARAAFSFPAELTANWAFQISDANQTRRCMIAMRKWIVVCGVAPLFLLAGAAGAMRSFSYAVVSIQIVVGLTVSILLVELMFFDFREKFLSPADTFRSGIISSG